MKPIACALALAIGLTGQPIMAHDHGHLPKASQSQVQMTTAASNLLNSLSQTQLDELIYPFSDDKARTAWTNAPVSSKARNGLPIGRFSLEQRAKIHQLLIASTSSQGYQKLWAAVRSDDELKREGENRELDSKKFFAKNQSIGASNYWLSFYGDPRSDQNWGYMLTGHHLAANFSVVEGKPTFVPLFYGADPGTIASGSHAGHEFLPFERNRGLELLQSLNSEQQKIAVVADEYPANKYGAKDFAGPGKKDAKREYRGLAAAQMNQGQQQLLWMLIEEYVHNADHDVADAQMAKIRRDGLEKLHFMWMGPTDGSHKVFFRVHGPSILIDFVDQRTGFDWNTHPHTIVRDPSNDYGENWLQRHIQESH